LRTQELFRSLFFFKKVQPTDEADAPLRGKVNTFAMTVWRAKAAERVTRESLRFQMQDNSAQFLPRTQTNMPSLYERLGGIYSIACVVDDLIDRIMTDARLNANPAVNEAHHRVPPPGFKYLVTEMVGSATGGRQKYTGRTMLESHEHLNITPKEWEAFMDDFQQTLDKFKVPADEQAELKAIVQSTYGDIVIGKS
jgi:hemoglobin